jgi:tetratricopeptide (TPR) repeat protein
MFPRVAITGLLLLAACKDAATKAAPEPAPRADACAGGVIEKTGAISWFEDDLGKARACAAQKQLPLVIDEWAPWCHTCLSMKTIVFTDPAFAPLAERFVWLSTDTDKDVNAEVVASYTPGAWPTFWVIDAAGAVNGRYVGAASVDQFRDFLTQSERTFLAGAKLDPKSADGLLVAAERKVTEATQLKKDDPTRLQKLTDAADAYEAALDAAPADWPRRPDVLVSAIGTIERFAPPPLCVEFARKHLAETGRSSSVTDFIVSAIGCANGNEEQDREGTAAFRLELVARLEALLADATAPLSADDRADAMMNLRELYDQLGRPADALATAEKERALLDEAAAKAPTPFAAMTYNWPRAETYAYLQKHDELIPALEKSAADLPEEYDPPYRIAWLYSQADKLDLALQWARKSVALAYGPRKARVQSLIVDVLRRQGNAKEELVALRELLAIYKSLPPGQARPEEVSKAEVDLAALEALSEPRNGSGAQASH